MYIKHDATEKDARNVNFIVVEFVIYKFKNMYEDYLYMKLFCFVFHKKATTCIYVFVQN